MHAEDKVSETEMDRILSKHDDIVPSSGFTACVMEAVGREAVVLPPIPFPWKRALPVLALAAGALLAVLAVAVAVSVQLSRVSLGAHLPAASVAFAPLAPFFQHEIGTAAGWTALSLLVAFVSVKVSARLAGPGR